MKIKKGDIGVRTGGFKSDIGKIYEALGESKLNSNRFLYASGLSIVPEDFRLATQEEIEAYHLGCRHINYLDKYINREILLTTIL